jgi:hypothetical protein
MTSAVTPLNLCGKNQCKNMKKTKKWNMKKIKKKRGKEEL